MARARTEDAGEDSLATYRAKRRFDETPEPKGRRGRAKSHRYSIQKHEATRLHYDLRLELEGVLKSWAIPRGPSLDPGEKRLAVRTEDHPADYIHFEGRIPEHNYGAGNVLLWDQGEWEPLEDPASGIESGKLKFRLLGQRLRGQWTLVRMRDKKGEKRENWLMIKEDDEEADRDNPDITEAETTSVASGRTIDDVPDLSPKAAKDAKARQAPPRNATKENASKGNTAKTKRAKPPRFQEPALATLVDTVPDDEGWIFEMKFDGYRSLAAVSGDAVTIYTRKGLDWSDRYTGIVEALAALDLDGVLLDGEIVVADKKGKTSFSDLQKALKEGKGKLSYFVFDLLAADGASLRGEPLLERKKRLKQLLGKAGRTGPVFYTDHLESGGVKMHERLCSQGFEGIIAKRESSTYRSGRGKSWLKIKCDREQEFVIAGWSPSDRDRPFSSILLGVYEDGALIYAGRVGTGFSDRELDELAARFAKLARKTSPFDAVPKAIARNARWLRPELVAQVAFTEFTADGSVRHGRYLGLREDKAAKEVVREKPADTGSGP